MDLRTRIAEAEDACAAMLELLLAGQARLQEEFSAFRAETRAGFEAIRGELGGVKTNLRTFESGQAQLGEMLTEILRRLPEQ